MSTSVKWFFVPFFSCYKHNKAACKNSGTWASFIREQCQGKLADARACLFRPGLIISTRNLFFLRPIYPTFCFPAPVSWSLFFPPPCLN